MDKIKKKNEHKEKRRSRDKAGGKKVRCEFCLDSSHTLKYLPTHIEKLHADFFQKGTNRNDYVASADQTVPADPKFLQKAQHERQDLGAFEDKTTMQRVKTGAVATTEQLVSRLFYIDEGFLSQDDVIMFGGLTELLDLLPDAKDFEYF